MAFKYSQIDSNRHKNSVIEVDILKAPERTFFNPRIKIKQN